MSCSVSHVKTSFDIGDADSHERRCIRAAQAAQADRARHTCVGSTEQLKRSLQDKLAQRQPMGHGKARYPVLRGFKPIQGQGSRVSREEFHKAVQLRVPGASLQVGQQRGHKMKSLGEGRGVEGDGIGWLGGKESWLVEREERVPMCILTSFPVPACRQAMPCLTRRTWTR
jgi:hypothetical protein